MNNDKCDGLWSVVFSGNALKFSGVVILENGRLMGGDSNYIYSGYYNLENQQFISRMVVTKYNKLFKTILPDKYTVSLKGEYNDDVITLPGNPEEFEDFALRAECTKQSNLIKPKEKKNH